ncbi:hypothetical protein LPJ61_003777 [Coemansia biformis]|uniref:Ribonucleases P/MRP subunit Pop8-like domain-containing protein n=1 Tax=Coemansia biformis TaxID=1286918 RepID=A0A9W7YAK8_9FUNG|nr:hypothetical protein LPJ61_003777 [Coemansia biformis]
MEIDQPLAARAEGPFRTTISKQPFYYFAITLVTGSSVPISASQYREYLLMVLNQWLGAIGGGMPVELMDYDYPRATIRVPYDSHKAAWQAMTVNPFKLLDGAGASAHFQVVRGSAFSMGVATSSRSSQA